MDRRSFLLAPLAVVLPAVPAPVVAMDADARFAQINRMVLAGQAIKSWERVMAEYGGRPPWPR